MEKALNYSDVVLQPRFSSLDSRSDADTSINFLGKRYDSNVCAANMPSVINEDLCKWMAFNNKFYVMHRFTDTRKFIQRARAESWPLISISVGVKGADRELIEDIKLSKCRVDVIVIDVAHGLAQSTVNMIRFIRENLPDTKVIAGNIWGNKDSVERLQNEGAQGLKIGLSLGAGCSTYPTTGFASPMFSAALEAGRWAKVPVILDGGIRVSGDVAKAIVAFTSVQKEPTYGGYPVWHNPINVPMVMAGSIFAACIDAPGETIYAKIDGYRHTDANSKVPDDKTKPLFKRYYGNASAENKQKTGQEVKHVEGITVELPCNGMTFSEKFYDLKQAISSSISYAGSKNLAGMKDVRWMSLK